jgi:hypothetical protein
MKQNNLQTFMKKIRNLFNNIQNYIEKYKIFVRYSGYTYYEKQDAYDVLYNYGFNDNWTALSIPWTKLLIALINKINIKNIHLWSCVEK